MADNVYKNMDDNIASSYEEPKSKCKSITLWLMISIIHSLIGVFLMGYNLSLFNVPETTIRAHAAEYPINQLLWEIVNAMFPIGALFGAAFSGKLSDRFGRKKLIIFNAIINIIASIITATSCHYAQLLIGRFITGIAAGAATVIGSAYLNEISPDNLRGAIGSLLQLTITFAIVVSELLGKVWRHEILWRYGCSAGALLCTIQLLFCYALLESPKWLIAQNRISEAIVILKKLRGINFRSDSLDIPMQPTEDCHDTAHNTFHDDEDTPTTLSLCSGIKRYPAIKYIFCISLFLHMLQQLSGANVIFYYSTNILQSIGFKDVWFGSLLLSIANFIAVAAVTPLMDRWGRRNLLLLSSIGMVLSSFAITIPFIGIHETAGTEKENEWGIVMILCMIAYVMFFEIGLGPIPFLIVAELSPIEYRGAMISASQVVNYGCNTIIAATSVSLLGALGAYGFVPFGCICSIGVVVIFCYVPETNQKTTKQIIDDLDPTYYAIQY